MKTHTNIAARAGRWSARHRKTAIFGWLAFVIVALAIGSAVGTKTLDSSESGVGESGRADRTQYEAFPKRAEESVLIQSRTDASSPGFRAVIRDVEKRVAAVPHVSNVKEPTISKDGHSALLSMDLVGDSVQSEERVDALLGTVAAADRDHAGYRIEEFGAASSAKALSESFQKDFQKAEVSSLPVTLIILLIAFGSLVAAGVPVLLALSGVGATIGLVGPLSQLMPVDEAINSVILLIGLAVGVDYALFYIRREREERAAGRSAEAALEAAAATSGRAILVSGLTVMVAMAGMYFAGAPTFSSMASGTILVVAIAMIGSVTVLPAVLSKLGDRIDRGRLPFIGRRRRARAGESRVWGAILRPVLRRPVAAAAISGALLVALAVPALGLQTKLPGTDTLPRDLAVMQTYDRIQEAFPGDQISADVVVSGTDVTSSQVRQSIADLREQASRSKDIVGPSTVSVSPGHDVAVVSLPIAGDGTNDRSVAALDTIREDLVPATVGKVATADVAGMTASTEDFNSVLGSHVFYVFAFVLAMAFMLLLVTFRSIVIPVKAIVLNLLSVGAAYGLLVLVFQHGVGAGLLGVDSTGPITAWLPLFLFVILFGLSMDYHVFILTRIREAFDRGMTTEQAVDEGIRSTAGTVTSAAFVMVAVFAIFATLSGIDMKQMGVGLAFAVLIDATIIRGVLLPASMKLLGDWNWYLPRRLGWLPQIRHEPSVEAARA